MTTKAKKVKWVEEPFKSMYVSFANRYPASFLGAAARLNKDYIIERELVDKMMVWSFIEKNYSIPSSKDYSGTQFPYIRITKLYNRFKDYCRKYRVVPCSFKVFRDEIRNNLEMGFTSRGGQHAVYLVNCQHPAFQNARNDSKYDFDIFSSPSTLDIWQLFGKKKPWVKCDEMVDITYHIRGGLDICLKKKFVLAGEGEI